MVQCSRAAILLAPLRGQRVRGGQPEQRIRYAEGAGGHRAAVRCGAVADSSREREREVATGLESAWGTRPRTRGSGLRDRVSAARRQRMGGTSCEERGAVEGRQRYTKGVWELRYHVSWFRSATIKS
jgi:hypothetical protein